MLSKCVNPRCSAKFRYLRQGRLYRIDFFEESRKRRSSGGNGEVPGNKKLESIEHFWLCEKCAGTLALEIGEGGELRLVPIAIAPRKPPASELPEIQDIASNA